MPSKTLEDRFWEKVIVVDDDCWPWMAHASGKNVARLNYGTFHSGMRTVPAHRFSYELKFGPIPDGLVIDHLCHNPICVNPDHLEPVTQSENVLRGENEGGPGQSLKTHCKNGHPLSGENLITTKSGVRRCRTCRRRSDRRSWSKNSEKYLAQKKAARLSHYEDKEVADG